VPNGRHTAFYVAKEKGLYQGKGMNVTIYRGAGSPDSMKKVAGGTGHFTISDSATAIMARSRDLPVKIIGFLDDKGQMAIFALEGTGIRGPKDLEGRSAGDSPVGNIVFFPAIAKLYGVKDWKLTVIDPAAKLKSLVAGTVDFIVGVTTQYPVLVAMGEETGKKIVYMPFTNLGLDLYGTGFLTRDQLIQENPDLVRRFAHATTEAMAWSVENPEEAVNLFVRANPTTTPRLVRAQWDMVVDQMKTDRFRRLGYAWAEEGKMAYTIETVTELMKLPRKVSSQEMYTNEFLPKIMPKF
jgi:NitT/TauT family transport system substrate-binding protein